MKRKNFCVLPFNSVSFSATGQLRPCCNAYNSNFQKKIKDLSVEEIINHDNIKKLREEFLNDTRSQLCKRCWDLEDQGMISYRQINNDYHKIKDIEYYTNKQIDFDDIEYLDITLGNKCNLACRMCNQFSSSLLAKNLIDIGLYNDLSGKKGLIDFNNNDELKILDLIKKSKNLNSIYFLGGEPLINDFHEKILQTLINENRADRIYIKYNTNMHIDIKKFFAYWIKFKNVEVNASIDGTDSIYEYIRWPGNFNKVYENMKLAMDYKTEYSNLKLGISVVNQNLNATNMLELINRFQNIGVQYSYWFITVTGNNYLELTPTSVIEEQLSLLKQKLDPNIHAWKNLIQNYESACDKAKSIDYQDVVKFFTYSKQLDLYRKQNLFYILPYMKDLANQFNIELW